MLLTALLLLMMTFVLPAHSQELISNGQFDADLVDWVTSNGLPVDRRRWVAGDVDGSPTSGSVELTNVGLGNNGFQRTLHQCISVLAEERYLLAGWGKAPSDEPGNAGLLLSALLYQTEDCSGPLSGSFNSTAADPDGAWEVMVRTFETFSTTRSVAVALALGKDSGFTQDVTGQVDAVSLVPDKILTSNFQ